VNSKADESSQLELQLPISSFAPSATLPRPHFHKPPPSLRNLVCAHDNNINTLQNTAHPPTHPLTTSTMGLISKAIGITGWSALAATGTFVAMTRKNRILPVPASDYIFNTTHYARYNPYNSPVTQDICLRQVPLSQIKPEYLDGDGKLLTERSYLEKKYRGPETAGHLWERKELAESKYEVGTLITDHFEVVSKTDQSIMVRCGDSPRKMDARESDGLFEMTAEIKQDEGVAEFGLKSVFYNGLSGYKSGSAAGPMPGHVQWLHQQYDKVLMESAIRNVTK
jgi:hypothetical protein